jgi:hypothetical protein
VADPRGHHFVPQLYQRGFARKKGNAWQVRVVARGSKKEHIANVENTFKRRDWNTVLDEDSTKDFAVEHILANLVDGPAAPVFEAMRADRYPLDDEQRWRVARFMSAQLTRGTHAREELSKFMVESMRHMAALAAQHYTDEHWMKAIGEVPNAEFRKQLLNSEDHFDIRPTNAGLLGALLGNVEEIAWLLLPRSWTLVRFATPCLFTSEHPVVYMNRSGHAGYGVATADQIYLPVSTTHGLVLSTPWAGWPDALVNGSEELARRLNWAVLSLPTSDELLLHPDIDSHPLPRAAVLARGGRWPWPEDDRDGGEMPDYWQRLVERTQRRHPS